MNSSKLLLLCMRSQKLFLIYILAIFLHQVAKWYLVCQLLRQSVSVLLLHNKLTTIYLVMILLLGWTLCLVRLQGHTVAWPLVSINSNTSSGSIPNLQIIHTRSYRERGHVQILKVRGAVVALMFSANSTHCDVERIMMIVINLMIFLLLVLLLFLYPLRYVEWWLVLIEN